MAGLHQQLIIGSDGVIEQGRGAMNTVRTVAVVVGMAAVALALFHAIGGELSVGAWAGILIALAAGVGAAVGGRRRCWPFDRTGS